ncbi:MAG: AsmA family protein [Pseudomonadota bacterium]
MKKLFKFLIWTLVVVVVLVGAAAVAVPMLVDPNDYRDQLAAVVKEQTGRVLQIEGDLNMTVFPWLGVDVGPASLSNADGFKAAVFASSERIQVRVKLEPLLLEQRLEMDTVTVKGLKVNLERDADGASNWDDLAKTGNATESVDKAESGDAPPLAAIVLGGLDVSGAQLAFADRQAGQDIKLSNVSLKTGVLTPGQPVPLEAGLDVSLAAPAASGRVTLKTTLSVDGDVVRAKDLEIAADLSGRDLPGGKLNARLGTQVELDNAARTASLKGLSLSLADLQLNGGLTVTGLDQPAPAAAGKISIARFDLRKLLADIGQQPPVTADAKVLTAVAVNADLAANSSSLKLSPLSVTLDDSKLTGVFAVSNFARPALRFDLTVDQIDADRYLPPQSGAKKAATPGAAATSAAGLPVEQLRALNIDGKLKLGKLRISGLSLSDLKAAVKAKAGVIKATPLSAKLYGGSYAGNVGIDARGKAAKVSLNETLKGVQIGPLLKDLQGEDRLEGTAAARLKATMAGNDPEAMKRTLNGSGSFSFANGALKGVNIAAMIRDAKAKILGGGGADPAAPQRTDFSTLGGSFRIKNGLVSNNDFAAKSPLLRIKGKGTANLVSEALNYRTTTSVVATAKGQGGKELADLAGIDIPLKITGTFSEPQYGLDVEAFAKLLATQKAKDLLGKGTGGVKKAVEGKLKDAVGGAAGKGAVGALTKQLGIGGGDEGKSGDGGKADPAAAAGKALKNLFGN